MKEHNLEVLGSVFFAGISLLLFCIFYELAFFIFSILGFVLALCLDQLNDRKFMMEKGWK